MLLRYWRVNMILIVFFGLFGCSLPGICARVPSAPMEARTVALQFTPPANKSYIFIMRHARFAGCAIYHSISLDGQIAGTLANYTFILFEVQPGKHEIVAQATTDPSGIVRGKFLVGALTVGAAKINCLPGKSYFFATKVPSAMPSDAGLEVNAVPEEDGRRYITEYEMVLTSHKLSIM